MRDLSAYVQYLIVSPSKYVQDYFGQHHDRISHDQINRQMRHQFVRPRDVWKEVRGDIIPSKNSYIIFDDSTLNKQYSQKIALCGYHWSGKDKKPVMGISTVNAVYINPDVGQSWVIDFRIYHPPSDGKTKLDHMEDMLKNAMYSKDLPFRGVLMDTWYATSEMMTMLHSLGKYFICPIKKNRKIKRSVHWTIPDYLDWDGAAGDCGERIVLKGVSKSVPMRLHRRTLLTKTGDVQTDYIVTNDVSLTNSQRVMEINALRWKVEEYHRELKQLTGIEKCQCRKARAQRNHVACAVIAWIKLKRAAQKCKTTIYQVKQKLMDNYIHEKLNQPLDATFLNAQIA